MINNNRQQQNGRRRGRGGSGGGGQRPGGNPGRPEAGNRIDNRARGNAAQLHEKYKTLARDAQMQGDRVNTEYYLQFADHYFRVLAESRSRFEENNGNRQQEGDFDDGDDFDGDMRLDQQRDLQQQSRDAQREQQPREQSRDGQRDGGRDGPRDQQSRDGQQRDSQRDGQQRDSQRDGQRRYEQQGDGRRNSGNAANGNGFNDNAPRGDDRDRDQEQPRRERFQRDRDEQPEQGVVASEGEPVREAPAPRKLRAPRRDAQPAIEESGLDAALLPPALGIGFTADAEDAEPDEKPKRRRGRPPASDIAEAS